MVMGACRRSISGVAGDWRSPGESDGGDGAGRGGTSEAEQGRTWLGKRAEAAEETEAAALRVEEKMTLRRRIDDGGHGYETRVARGPWVRRR